MMHLVRSTGLMAAVMILSAGSGHAQVVVPGDPGTVEVPILEDNGDGSNSANPGTQFQFLQGSGTIVDNLDQFTAPQFVVDTLINEFGIPDPISTEPGLADALNELNFEVVNPIIDEAGTRIFDPLNVVSVLKTISPELIELQLVSTGPIELPQYQIPLSGGGFQPFEYDLRQTLEDSTVPEFGKPTFMFTDGFKARAWFDEVDPFSKQPVLKLWTWMWVLKKITVTIQVPVRRVFFRHKDDSFVATVLEDVEVDRWVFVRVHSHPPAIPLPMLEPVGPMPGTGSTSEMIIEEGVNIPVLTAPGIAILMGALGAAVYIGANRRRNAGAR